MRLCQVVVISHRTACHPGERWSGIAGWSRVGGTNHAVRRGIRVWTRTVTPMQIREAAENHPDKAVVILYPSGTELSFAELEARANRLAQYFRKAGLREGDTVAAILENNDHIHALMWAARRAGLYYALINTHLTPAEAAYIV